MNGLVKSDRKPQQVNGYTDQRSLTGNKYFWIH